MYSLNIGVIAMIPEPWALEENYRRLEAHVREAARRRAQVVVAPEGVLDGYVCAADPDVTRERMLEIAEPVPEGSYLRRAAALCRALGIYFVFGVLERAGDTLHNACVLLDPRGEVIARYRKVHPDAESFITPGKELRPFDTPIGRIGFLICSDRHTVDNWGTLGTQGVELVFLPMNGSFGPENTAVLRQRARDNCCSIVCADANGSVIIGPVGDLYLEKHETECVGVGRLLMYHTPKGPERDHFAGRRPDLYQPLMRNAEATTWFDEKGDPTPFAERKRAEWREQLRKLKGR